MLLDWKVSSLTLVQTRISKLAEDVMKINTLREWNWSDDCGFLRRRKLPEIRTN